MPPSITIKQLHATTGEQVRLAGKARVPVVITDRGKAVAVLGSPSLLKPRHRKRTILPGYEALMAKQVSDDLSADVDAIRNDR